MGLITAELWQARGDCGQSFASADISGGKAIPRVDLRGWGTPFRLSVPDITAKVNCQEIDQGFAFALPTGSLRVYRASEVTFPDKVAWRPEFGLTRYELVLNSPPAINRFDSRLELPAGAHMVFQPPLEQWEIDGVHNGNYIGPSYRPPWCVGSYVLYSARNLPLVHFARPFATDADGKGTFGDYEWNPVTGILSKVFSSLWLMSARYPVTLDPVVGYDTIGGTTHNAGPDYQDACGPWTPEASGTIDEIEFYTLADVNRPTTCGLWEDSTGSPATRIRDTAEESIGGSTTWNTFTLDSQAEVDTGTPVWLGWNNDDGTLTTRWNANSTGLAYRSLSYTSGSLTDPYGTPDSTLANRQYSIYATITPAAAGVPWADHHYRTRRAG